MEGAYAKKIILCCFRFEDTVDDAMAAVKKKDFAAEDIKLIEASGEQFLAEANEGYTSISNRHCIAMQ